MEPADQRVRAIWPTVSPQQHRSPSSNSCFCTPPGLSGPSSYQRMLPVSSSFQRVCLYVAIPFLTLFALRVILMGDSTKRAYTHAPGPCRYIPNIENGSAGFQMTSSGVFMSLGSAYPIVNGVRPQIGLFDLKNTQNYQWDNLRIEGSTFDKKHFSPRHLSAYESKGRLSLYVVNGYPGYEGLEMFTFVKEKKTLLHRKSLTNSRLATVSSVVAVGPDRLFLTNLAYFSTRWLRTAELLFQSDFGSLLLFDGTTVKVVDSRIPSPSSLAYDQKNSILYVGSLFNELVRVYKVKKDLSVVLVHDIPMLSSPSGLFVEPATGDLWISLYPVLYQAVYHWGDPTAVCASQILRVRMQKDSSWVITEPYASDGASISASHAVLFHEERLLIGSLYGKAILCDTNKDQIT